MLRPLNVERAAPGTPSLGNGPQPRRRQGESTRLMMLEAQSKHMAMPAAPARRKMALLRNSILLRPPPPTATQAETGAVEMAGGEVLVRASEGLADGAPKRGRRRGDGGLFQWHIDLYVLRGRLQGFRRADAVAAIK